MQQKVALVRLILFGLFAFTVTAIYFYRTTNLLPVRTIPSSQPTTGRDCPYTLRDSNSKWFKTKYNVRIKPFWNADHIKINEDVAKWWHSIQASRSVDLESTLRDLFNEGMPKYQNINFPKKRNCLVCAVVGNSANLKESGYGKAIDSHDVVIRFNQGPTLGFEEDVGSKTTHRIIYPESATHFTQETSLTLVPFKPLDVEWLLSAITTGSIKKTYMPVMRRITCNVSRIAILHPEFIRHVHSNWLDRKGRYPSTGAIGVGLALQTCDKVDIFGFGADKNGGWQHYWQKLSDAVASAFRKTGVHSGDKQEEFLEKLASEGIARLYRGTGI